MSSKISKNGTFHLCAASYHFRRSPFCSIFVVGYWILDLDHSFDFVAHYRKSLPLRFSMQIVNKLQNGPKYPFHPNLRKQQYFLEHHKQHIKYIDLSVFARKSVPEKNIFSFSSLVFFEHMTFICTC